MLKTKSIHRKDTHIHLKKSKRKHFLFKKKMCHFITGQNIFKKIKIVHHVIYYRENSLKSRPYVMFSLGIYQFYIYTLSGSCLK